MKKLKILVVVLSVLFLYSCGYNFVGSYSSLPNGIDKVFVENIKNLTSEPNLQTYLKTDIINELQLDSRVSVVDKDRAQGLIKVAITNYDVSASSFGNSGFASRYRCTITAKVSLLQDGKSIIKDKVLTSYKDFNANNEVNATEIARNITSKDVLKDLSVKIKDELFVNF